MKKTNVIKIIKDGYISALEWLEDGTILLVNSGPVNDSRSYVSITKVERDEVRKLVEINVHNVVYNGWIPA